MPSLVSDFTSSAITLSRAASIAARTSSMDAVFFTMRRAILPGHPGLAFRLVSYSAWPFPVGVWMATDYAADKIRNVVLLGHSHDGKTMLAEAMLFASGAVARMGAPDQATATTDFEPEEHKRKISITLGVAFAEHNGHKINIIDAPGFFDFAGQVISGLRAAEGAVVVVGPTAQLAVGTEVAWEFCNRSSKPRIVVVNKLDKENSDFYGAVAAMRETLTPRPFPLHLPIGAEQDFRGIVDLLHMKAFVTADDGKGGEVPIPDDMKKLVDEYRGQLIEAAAESDDSLLEKYLDAGTLSEEEIQRGLREGILEGKVAPVVCCSATKLLGVRTLMSTIAELMPPPEVEPDKPVKAFVFSTGGDQFGRVSRSEEHTSELQSRFDLVCRLLLEK